MKRLMNINYGPPRSHLTAVALPPFQALSLKTALISGGRQILRNRERLITNTPNINHVIGKETH
jgi:hypothetical protein